MRIGNAITTMDIYLEDRGGDTITEAWETIRNRLIRYHRCDKQDCVNDDKPYICQWCSECYDNLYQITA